MKSENESGNEIRRGDRTHKLVVSAVLTALSVVLGCMPLWQMPMGGDVTPASMLPVMLVSVLYGCRWGLASGGVNAGFQLLLALIRGNVFPYCETGTTLALCILFDYVVPFTLLGLAGMFRGLSLGKFRHFGIYLGIFVTVAARFLCHFYTGVVVWGQWASEGMGKYTYSFLYNGSFLLMDFGLLLVVAVFLFELPQMKKILALPVDKSEEE